MNVSICAYINAALMKQVLVLARCPAQVTHAVLGYVAHSVSFAPHSLVERECDTWLILLRHWLVKLLGSVPEVYL